MKILRALKAWPWYYWLVALLVPGGLLVFALRRPSPVGVPTIDPDNAKAGEKFRIDQLIGSIKDKADALRSGLANDPLAASLIGVSPDVLKQGDSAKVAATTAEAADIRQHIVDQQAQIAKVDAEWSANHFGGVSYDQYMGYRNSLSSLLDGLSAKLAALLS